MRGSFVHRGLRTIVSISSIITAAALGAYGCSSGGSVGGVCEADDECEVGLSCSRALIMPLQCTTLCDDSSACVALFGQASFCIGAGLCVLACHDDGDCPSETVCNEFGWCRRGST